MSSSQAPQPNSPLPGDDRPVVQAGTDLPQASFEERAQLFWLENKKTILLTCALVLVILVVKEGVLYYLDQREQAIGTAFAAAEANPDKLRTFANENSGHKLAGLAWLSIGDEAFKAGKFVEAAAAYEKAEPLVVGGAFAGRAQIGRAFSLGLGGDKVKAEDAFKKIVADEKQAVSTRTEARYHLALLALEAGRTDDARKMLNEVQQGDATGIWTQRALALQANLPPEPVTAAPAETAAPAGSDLKLSLPGAK
jgi:tetratricopeptide (TPR) repeat protein